LPLILPQAKIFFEPERADARRSCQILVLGGRAPSPSWLSNVAYGINKDAVWAADHGVDACMVAGIIPGHVIGDFDSISEEGETWLRSNASEVEIERFPAEKNLTDFQLCLDRVKGEILVTGCWGGRFDHAFANVFSALWGLESGARILAFADELEILIPLAADEQGAVLELRLLSEAVISLLPLSESCEGVDVRGTKWELAGATLAQGRPYAVSNAPSGEKISVKIDKGIIGVYCFFK
jgi:thiamine pyrophosphokinase